MTGPPTTSTGSAFRDVRLIAIAIIAAASTFDPSFVYRQGVGLAVLAALPDLLRYRAKAADLFAFMFAGLMYASLTWTVSPTLTREAFANQIAVAILFVCIRACLINRRAFLTVAMGYLGGCVYGLMALLRQNAGASLSLKFDTTSTERYGLSGLNPNYTAYALAAGVGVAVLITSSRRTVWLTAFLAAAAAYAGIVLTGSRGAAVAAIATLAWWLLPARLRTSGIYVLSSLLTFSSIVIVSGAADRFIRSRTPAPSGRETGDLNGRLSIWPTARETFSENLWLGRGAGSFPSLNNYGIYAHDVFLDVAAGLGLVGLVGYLVLMYATLIAPQRSSDRQTRAFVVGTALACLAAPLLTGYWYQAPATWVVLALFSRATLQTSAHRNSATEIRPAAVVALLPDPRPLPVTTSRGKDKAQRPR